MLYKRLIVTSALAVAVAIPSIAFSAPKPAATTKKAAAATKPAPTKSTNATKATQEENIKKFKNGSDSAVVAIVGTEKITKADLANVLWDWYGPSALEYYISTRMVPQELKKAGLQVTEKEIDEAIKKVPIQPGTTLEAALQNTKTTMAQLRAGLALKIGLQKLVEKQFAPTDAEYATFIKASHILVSTMPTGGSKPSAEDTQKMEQTAKEKADKIVAEIKAGKPFAQAAKEYSEDPGSQNEGGELGWFRKSDMVGEFSEAAAKLQPGQMSEPVKTRYGYHIIMVEKLGTSATGADKAEIKKMLVESSMNAKMQQLFTEIKAKTPIDNKLSPKLEAEIMPSSGPMSYPGGTQRGVKPNQPEPKGGKDVKPTSKPLPNEPKVPADKTPSGTQMPK